MSSLWLKAESCSTAAITGLRPGMSHSGHSRNEMKPRTLMAAVLVALCLVGVNRLSAARDKQPLSPPSMSKLAEAIVMAPLADGRLIAVVQTGLNAHQAMGRYSSDGGRT